MHISYEEVFYHFGQFDTLVTIHFYEASEAYQNFGPTLMGTFFYTVQERNNLEASIKTIPVQSTSNYIKFVPSSEENLTDAQKIDLDKKGFNNTDIADIFFFKLPRTNRYTSKGEKEIPNTIPIGIDYGDSDYYYLLLSQFKTRLKNGYGLSPEEEFQYLGLELFYNSGNISGLLLNKTLDPCTGKTLNSVRFYELEVKFVNSELSESENTEFKSLIENRASDRVQILIKELNRSSEKVKELANEYHDQISVIIKLCVHFNQEIILPFKFPIWWDFERFIHIYLRHVKETKVGERFEGKSIFQYKFNDITRIISIVVENTYSEIESHFKSNPNQNFKRIGKRSIYYDGNYYSIEIEPNGRLLTFYPLNDDQIRPN